MSNALPEVWFYHLERQTADDVLPALLERTLARGWRAAVETVSVERAAALDGLLWSYTPESFLPHGLSSDAEPERQPVLILNSGGAAANAAAVRFFLDGAPPQGLAGLTRAVVLFDGADDAALAAAREDWRRLKAAGHAVTYWQQGAAGWEKRG